MSKKVAVISLGCDKNRVDTERMLYNLIEAGHSITSDYGQAEIIIVNTCAFIRTAREESIDTVLSAARYKNEGKCEKLIVTGCLPQKYLRDLEAGLTEADAFLGVRDYDTAAEVIERLYKGERVAAVNNGDVKDNINRTVSTPAHYAYLKIADGCDNKCTFCTIPSIRGGYNSRSIESLVSEARTLVEGGAREIILAAQDVTRYGTDLYGKSRLVDLIRELSKLDLKWIRLLYCYPELVTDELIDEIDNNVKVAKYIDIPLQHYDDGILKLMNRRGRSKEIDTLIGKIRSAKNRISIRTTLMVGFPSETEEQFLNLYNFVERTRLEHIGIFAYSTEEGTPSSKIKPKVFKHVKAERVERLGALHLKHRKEMNAALVGRTVEVLYEDIDYDRNLFKGRTEGDAPNVDTNVYFKGSFAEAGSTYKVKITGYDEYDLLGEIVE